MDPDLLRAIEELSLISTSSTDGPNHHRSPHNESQPPTLACDEANASELRDAANVLLSEMGYRYTSSNLANLQSTDGDINGEFSDISVQPSGDCQIDRSKLLVALLGGSNVVTDAVKLITRLVSLGKQMEQIYRLVFRDPNISIDLKVLEQLIVEFTNLYNNSDSYVRDVNVVQVYQAFCQKMIGIHRERSGVYIDYDVT